MSPLESSENKATEQKAFAFFQMFFFPVYYVVVALVLFNNEKENVNFHRIRFQHWNRFLFFTKWKTLFRSFFVWKEKLRVSFLFQFFFLWCQSICASHSHIHNNVIFDSFVSTLFSIKRLRAHISLKHCRRKSLVQAHQLQSKICFDSLLFYAN